MADKVSGSRWDAGNTISLASSSQKLVWLHHDTFLASSDRSVVLVDARPAKPVVLRTWARSSGLQAIAAHPNPQFVVIAATTGDAHQLYLCDIEAAPDGEEVALRKTSAGVVAVLALQHEPLDVLCTNEKQVAVLDKSGMLSLRTWRDNDEVPVEPVQATQAMESGCRTASRGSMCFASSPTEFGKCATAPGTFAPVLVTAGTCGWIRLWDASNLQLISTLWTTLHDKRDNNGDCPCICPLPHGLLAAGTGTGGVLLLKLPTDLGKAAKLEAELAAAGAPGPTGRRQRPRLAPDQGRLAASAPAAAQWGSIGVVDGVVSYCTLGLHPFRARAGDERPLVMATGCAGDYGPNLIDVGRLRPFLGFDSPEPRDWAAVAGHAVWAAARPALDNCRGALAKASEVAKPDDELVATTNWTWRVRQGEGGVVVATNDRGDFHTWQPPEPFRPADAPVEPLLGVNFRPWIGNQDWARRRSAVLWRFAARPPRRFRTRR